MSADGDYGLTLIAFIGSVFSPYYAWARRRGDANPLDHCSINVALYGRRGARWAMTERGKDQVQRTRSSLQVGPSALEWNGDGMTLTVDERCAPLPRRIRGTIRLKIDALGAQTFRLDAGGRHVWTPFAPSAAVEVDLSEPSLKWSGLGYLDSNSGAEPLEQTFRYWTWSRTQVPDGTVVLYDIEPRHEAVPQPLALRFGADAVGVDVEPPPVVPLARTGWRVSRRTRVDSGHAVRVVETLEDAPFYSRSLLDTRLLGARGPAIHESLDLDRFRAPWVQCLLPFRMPRFAR